MKVNKYNQIKLIFITCMPMSEPRSASMYFMKILLDRHANIFTWFSLRKTQKISNEWEIPYCSTSPIKFPKSNSNLRILFNLYPWAIARALKAIWFGRKNNVQVVLSDLAFEAVIVGRLVAKILNIPLISMIHDDPINRIEKKTYPSWLVNIYNKSFIKTLKYSESIMVISDYMGEHYKKNYGIKYVTLFPGKHEKEMLPLKSFDSLQKNFTIGLVGSINCMKNLENLIKVCEDINKFGKYGKIKIIHIGKTPSNVFVNPILSYEGYLEEKLFIKKLIEFDIGYLNWDFNKQYRTTFLTSFPLKVHTYIQAGVPLLAVGPTDSSIIKFVNENNCCLSIIEQNYKPLYDGLLKLLENKKYLNSYSKSINQLRSKFSIKRFHSNFLGEINKYVNNVSNV